MKLFLLSTIAVFSALFLSVTTAQTKVVVVPLGDSAPEKTKLAFPSISNSCLNPIATTVFAVIPEVSGNPINNFTFFIDDRDKSNPILTYTDSEPTLPDSTSELNIAITSDQIEFEGEVIDILDGQFSISNDGNNFFIDSNDCINSTTSTRNDGFSTNIEENTIIAESITGRTWEVTSNVTVRDGTMTLGPFLFQLVEP